MEYVFPNAGYANINDQFMLGNDVLIAPMVNKGTGRTVVLPAGKWRGDDRKVYKGPAKITINVPLDRLPYFEKVAANNRS
jgi:alpha-glucosidase